MSTPKPAVLVVDDDRSLIGVLGAALEQLGYDPLFAFTSDDAEMQLANSTPTVVLCDFELPGALSPMDVQRLVTERDGSSFVLMTGHRAGDVLDGFAPGTTVLEKPFGLATLQQLLRDTTA